MQPNLTLNQQGAQLDFTLRQWNHFLPKSSFSEVIVPDAAQEDPASRVSVRFTHDADASAFLEILGRSGERLQRMAGKHEVTVAAKALPAAIDASAVALARALDASTRIGGRSGWSALNDALMGTYALARDYSQPLDSSFFISQRGGATSSVGVQGEWQDGGFATYELRMFVQGNVAAQRFFVETLGLPTESVHRQPARYEFPEGTYYADFSRDDGFAAVRSAIPKALALNAVAMPAQGLEVAADGRTAVR